MALDAASVDVKIPNAPERPQLDVDMTVLPLELVDSLNHAYFLHLLATDPKQVLPPGKSLLSMLSRSEAGKEKVDAESIQNKVEQMMRRAFWNEAVESLSNPTPSVQLARLNHLYKDLYEALRPILPAQHPLLLTLSSPLSPTSAPLRSAETHLREALRALRERCAPVRDAQVDALITQLGPDTGQGQEERKEAEVVVATVRGTLELAEVIKDDLTNFVLGAMPEKQLAPLIRQQARMQERATVLGLWNAEEIQRLWKAWVGEEGTGALMKRVVKALGEHDAVVCHLPRKDAEGVPVDNAAPNALPPPFLLSSPALFYMQNYLQAIVIAAALRILAHLPTDKNAEASDFVQRIWTLLIELILERRGAEEEDSLTKLINLEDEVVRARRMTASFSDDSATSGPTSDVEQTLRAAVQRTLQTTDPVFKLLQTRLLAALSARLAESPAEKTRDVVPPTMQTGKDSRPSKRPRLSLGLESDGVEDEDGEGKETERPLVVKGFEDPVLLHALGEAVHRIRKIVTWVEETWAERLTVKD
ncbi:hypothetical protein HWV62_19879 [Athelia sp. TMB]|nr:hypothetical protein HWV62_19879 [Athelia sp. TMB]